MADQYSEFDQVRRFWHSPRVEQTLLFHDIQSSIAHVNMLGETAIVDAAACQRVVEALEQIRRELVEGRSFLRQEDHDIHAALERRLEELVGAEAAALRVAKSRNDQIATDIRLWLREAVYDIFADLISLRKVLADRAEEGLDLVMPGYTHMQPAMPILLAHWWLAHEARFKRDHDRLSDLHKRLNLLPLGAYALAGTHQPIDRELVARSLGFDGLIENSLDAVSDRDFLVEFGGFASLVGIHVSQLGQELLLWSTQEYGFVNLRKPFVFGSVSMPQKRNPELLEILRSRPAAVIGRMFEFVAQLKDLPMGFSHDLQESLPALMDMVDQLKSLLELTGILLPGLQFNEERMKDLVSADLTNASNALDYLIERGIAQERASRIVESLVSYCKQRHKYLADLALSEWQQFSPAFEKDIYQHVTVEESVGSRSSYGGTSREQVAEALGRCRQHIEADREKLPQRAAQKLNVRQLESI